MNLKDQLDALLDATAFDSTGAKIGAVRQVYLDDASGKITFAAVSTGIFSADAIVPLHGARLLDDELHVDHTRAVIRDSPRPDDTEDALTPEQEAKLLEYYGVETTARLRGTAAQSSGPSAGAAGKPAGDDGKTTSRGAAKETGGVGAGNPTKTVGAGEDAAADPASAGRNGKGATTTRTSDSEETTDSPAPAKATGPGPATPGTGRSEDAGPKGPEPRRG